MRKARYPGTVREAPAPHPLDRGPAKLPEGAPKEPVLDIDNIQGNILAGFNKDFQTLLFLRVTDAERFRDWLRDLIPFIATTAEVLAFNRLFKALRRRRNMETSAVQATWVNVALSRRALELLAGDPAGLRERARAFTCIPAACEDERFGVDAFIDQAFLEGMPSRAVQTLGDPSEERMEGNPKNWMFGGPGEEPDVVVTVASDDRDDLDDEVARIEGTVYSGRIPSGGHARAGVEIVYKQQGATLPAPLIGHEHFGFLDGVSQPGVRGTLSESPTDVLTPRQNPSDIHQGKPGQDLLWPGEFVFGYPGQTDNPKGKVEEPGPNSLTEAGPGGKPTGPVWAQDGSYLVVRRLRQDVSGFHDFLESEAAQLRARGYAMTADLLGAKLVGRWRSGAPIMRAPNADNTVLADDECANNHFEFQDPSRPIPCVPGSEDRLCSDHKHSPSPGDRTGARCPFAAHIRKTYPRDDEGTLAEEINETTTQTHRLLRRGIPYGAPFYPPKDPDRVRDVGDRGLVFAAYQTSLVGQFEFVQSAWANNPDFKDKTLPDGTLQTGHDLIIGQANGSNGDRTRRFVLRLQDQHGRERVEIISASVDWVIPTGGGYFFAPSLDALCLLTGSKPGHRPA